MDCIVSINWVIRTDYCFSKHKPADALTELNRLKAQNKLLDASNKRL
jgi:hypothetical protein